MKLWLEKRHLDLKVNWKLSRNQTTFKENFIVHLKTSMGEFQSEIAPNIRYHETPESIFTQFEKWVAQTDLESLQSLENVEKSLNVDGLHHSLRFGIESVLLSFLAKKNNQTLSAFLGLPAVKKVATSYSLPIMPVGEIQEYLAPLERFESLKIKVNAESALEMLQEVSRLSRAKLRVDANEGWTDLDAFVRFQENLKGMNIELIEQPFPSSMTLEYRELKKQTPYQLLADESIEDIADFHELSQQFHAVNIKLMKTGSLLKARNLLFSSAEFKMKRMMGCMIETSIGISYGMLFSGLVEYVDLDGFLLIKNEPFHLVSEAEGLLSLN
jgi:L-Ala-D/L-Glu epimerase